MAKAAYLYSKHDIRIEEHPLPSLGPYDMLVRIVCCGVCGSDARMYFSGPTPRYISPVVLGHEISAEVVKLGSHVREFGQSDLVSVGPIIPCMSCAACSRGQDNLCASGQVVGCTLHGGMAEYMHIPAKMVLSGGVVKLGSTVSPRTGALAELVGCCLEGLDQFCVRAGDGMLVIGDGPIGLTFLQLAKLMGLTYVATSGRRLHRRRLAQSLGADEAHDAAKLHLAEHYSRSLDHVVVATANPSAAAEAMEALRPGGNLLLFSGYQYGSQISLDLNAIHYRQLHLHGSIDCTVANFRRATALLPNLRMEELITHALPLEQCVDAVLASKEPEAVKVVLEPGGTPI